MEIRFAKYHGTGNDFVIVREAALAGREPADVARAVCARTTGVGADGLLVVCGEPLEMRVYNSDGSCAPMCGNGIRCFAAYVSDEGLEAADIYPVRTGAGEMTAAVKSRAPFVCEIDMGKPDFRPEAAGILGAPGENFLRRTIELPSGARLVLSSLFLGTFHTVVWLDEAAAAPPGASGKTAVLPNINDEAALAAFGEALHKLPIFTKKTNVNMAVLSAADELTLRTYERGAGMTAACGTGACAAAVCARIEGRIRTDETRVRVKNGTLTVRFGADGEVFMSGPAVKIADGTFLYD